MKKNNEFTRIKLKSLYNTRDIGGMVGEGGRKIKSGLLYRSGKLNKLPRITKRELEELDIGTMIDFRTETERNEKPDTMLENCRYEMCPLVCTATPGITYEEKMRHTFEKEAKVLIEKYDDPDDYMIEMYRQMVTEVSSVDALKKFFRLLAEASRPVIFHCNSGKDRVGICAMLVESLLGVDRAAIVKDYMASQAFCRMKFFWYRLGICIAPASLKLKKMLFCIMRTKAVYIEKAMDYLIDTYGSVKDFCKKALGLSDVDIAELKDKYLEPSVGR